MISIPWQSFSDFQFDIALDGTVYILRIRWNPVAVAWAMDILTRSEKPMVLGNKLVLGAVIALEAQEPPGVFVVFSPSVPTYTSFAEGVSDLVYISRAELATI